MQFDLCIILLGSGADGHRIETNSCQNSLTAYRLLLFPFS